MWVQAERLVEGKAIRSYREEGSILLHWKLLNLRSPNAWKTFWESQCLFDLHLLFSAVLCCWMLCSRVQEQSFLVFNSKQPQHSLGFPKYHPIQMWPCTKSCFNPVQVLTAVYLLTVMPRSLDIWSACLLNFKLSGWNTVEIFFFWRSDTCSLPFFLWKKCEYSISSQPVVATMIKISQPFSLFT